LTEYAQSTAAHVGGGGWTNKSYRLLYPRHSNIV